jgi:hypothetical protein
MPIIPRGTVFDSGPPLRPRIYTNAKRMAAGLICANPGAVLDHEEPLPHPACDQAQ